MNSFSSEIVQRELQHVAQLYAELQSIRMRPNFKEDATIEEKRDVLNKMERLFDLCEVLYTRIQLSDDPECIQAKDEYRREAKELGLPTSPISSDIYKYAREAVENLRRELGVDTE